LLSKFKNIDCVTAYQSKSKQNNNNQTITKKKKSDYAYLNPLTTLARPFLAIHRQSLELESYSNPLRIQQVF